MIDPIELLASFRRGCYRDATDEDLSSEARAKNADAVSALDSILDRLRHPSLEEQHRLKVAREAAKTREE